MDANARPEAPPGLWNDRLFAALLALAAVVLYVPTLRYGFTNWDDPQYVLTNPLTSSLDPESIGRIFSHFYEANYFPLNLITYAIVRAAIGANAWAYHALNALLHAACTVLAFRVLRSLGRLPREAALGAAIFLAHPVQVESVAWIAQTKTLLSAVFGLGSLLWLLRYRDARAAGGGAAAYGLSLVLFLAALLSKPQAIAFPGLYFCAERATSGRAGRIPWHAWIPFGLLAIAGAWVQYLAQAAGQAVKPYGPLGLPGQLLTSLPILARYIRMLLLPTGLSLIYPVPPVASLMEPRVIGSALVLAAVAILAFRKRKTSMRPWHALGWFLAPLVPVLGWVPLNNAMADRYLYLPVLALGWVASDRLEERRPAVRRTLWAVPVLFACLALSLMPAWRDADALWQTAVRRQPEAAVAWRRLGVLRYGRSDLAGAESAMRRAVALDSRDAEAWADLAIVLMAEGRTAEGERALARGSAADPRAVAPGMVLAMDRAARGRTSEALRILDGVIRKRPDAIEAYQARGMVRQKSGDLAGAEADFLRAVERAPLLARAHRSLGEVREARGDLAGARKAYRAYLQLETEDAQAAFRVREHLQELGSDGGRRTK